MSYKLEYAKSGRSRDVKTKEPIEKGELRIGVPSIFGASEEGEPRSWSWMKVRTFFDMQDRKREEDKKIKDISEFDIVGDISDADKDILMLRIWELHDPELAEERAAKRKEEAAAKRKTAKKKRAAEEREHQYSDGDDDDDGRHYNDQDEAHEAHEHQEKKPKKAKKEEKPVSTNTLDTMESEVVRVENKEMKDLAKRVVDIARKNKLRLAQDELQAMQTVSRHIMMKRDAETKQVDIKEVIMSVKEQVGLEKEVDEEQNPMGCDANRGLANALLELAEYEFKVNAFKAQAYRKAANAISVLDFAVTSGKALSSGKSKVPGIGAGIGEKIDQFLASGSIDALEKYRRG